MRASRLGPSPAPLTLYDALRRALQVYNRSPNASGIAPDDLDRDNYAVYRATRARQRSAKLDRFLCAGGSLSSLVPSLHVGTLVRKQIGALSYDDDAEEKPRQSQFAKEHDVIKYSTTLYRITQVVPSSPIPSYRISTLDHRLVPGSFTKDQLLVIPPHS